MAVLSDADRAIVWSQFMKDNGGSVNCLKADIRAAVNALDDFLNSNASAINSAIPQPARSKLTTEQKALLLQFVIARRYISGA